MALGKQMTSPEDAATAGLHPVKGNKNQTDLSMLLSSCKFFFYQLRLTCFLFGLLIVLCAGPKYFSVSFYA